MPSPSTSVMRIALGEGAVGYVVASLNPPPGRPSETVTVRSPRFAVTRSGRPSPFRSCKLIAAGDCPRQGLRSKVSAAAGEAAATNKERKIDGRQKNGLP